jgi:hypothetical protein
MTRDQEMKCGDLELNVLMSIEDVTKRVNAAVTPDMTPEKAAAARRGVMADIENESKKKTGLRSDVVTLYNGGLYHLYRYKQYTDVRLVFAPEQQIAFYGGDPDNFEYPRYDLDVCFFRVYEDNKPAKIEHYLKWSKGGAKDDELVFVSGHPGKTDRMDTLAELEYFRDAQYPLLMRRLNRLEVLLLSFSGRSEEHARRAKELLFTVQNSRKARNGRLAGLLDPQLLSEKRDQDYKLQVAANRDDDLKNARTAWERIANAQKVRATITKPYTMLEGSTGLNPAGFTSTLFTIARTLLRAGEELPKPNPERLREYRESGLDSLKLELFSDEKLYDNYEVAKLADSLTFLCAELGYGNDLVKKVLGGKSPLERARELVKGTKLKDVALRKKLFEGGKEAVAAAKDPMIEVAQLIDSEARAIRKRMETEVEEPDRQAYGEIAKVKFALEGTSTYPDATFTLRLAFGLVKGYEEDGRQVHFETDFAGLYQKAEAMKNRPPFDLPERWLKAKDKLDLKTPLNFVCTADSTGGNSGSPLVNREGEVVGLLFDGNIQSLVLDLAYTEEQARTVAVHSRGIVEALRKVYDAGELANELTGHKE